MTGSPGLPHVYTLKTEHSPIISVKPEFVYAFGLYIDISGLLLMQLVLGAFSPGANLLGKHARVKLGHDSYYCNSFGTLFGVQILLSLAEACIVPSLFIVLSMSLTYDEQTVLMQIMRACWLPSTCVPRAASLTVLL